MIYRDLYSIELARKLKKLKSKSQEQYKTVMRKIDEIKQNPFAYKPMKYDLRGFRRVHILRSFVLIFKIDEKACAVKFEDIDHHDKIYKKRFI